MVSSTVTSVEDRVNAGAIVDALNMVSACATVPVSIQDERTDRYRLYPAAHLAAVTDPTARGDLLEGSHSLWYEQAKMLLHQALTDLDDAIAAVPAPVQKAIAAELEVEVRGLRDGLTEFSKGIRPPETEDQRCWDFHMPFVAFEGGLESLSSEARERLNQMERGATAEQLAQGVADLRLMHEAYTQTTNVYAQLLDEFTLTDDPFEPGTHCYYLNVEAPQPNGERSSEWSVEIGLWDVPPDTSEEETVSAHGETVLSCVRTESPTAAEIITLLNRSGGRSEQLSAWAKTPVGEALDGTDFVVTQRYDD
ncbi:hypothetical protein SAMN04489726_4663 [Allokutzneria albata]|uniref:Uncharacterized protein n=1 Tax=Allokutzneria albata TaxID=211114 RepID=A0A1G9Y8B3_ALLAB|nr:hypothetical protein SAMN04489726_4663 [Allokutzneria albata]